MTTPADKARELMAEYGMSEEDLPALEAAIAQAIKDAEARAEARGEARGRERGLEEYREHHAKWCPDNAEAARNEALDDAEMAVAGYVAVIDPKHVAGVQKLFRALKRKERPDER